MYFCIHLLFFTTDLYMSNQRRLSQNQFIGLKKDLMLKFHEGAQYICVDIGAEELYVYNANEDPILIAAGGVFTPPLRVFASDVNISPASSGNPTDLEVDTFNQGLPVPYKDTIMYYTGDNVASSPTTVVFHVDGAGAVTKISGGNAATTTETYAPGGTYVANQLIFQTSPTTGHPTLYRRIADGTAGAIFNAAEELLWTHLASLGVVRQFIGETALSPAAPGFPTQAEIAVFTTAINRRDLIYYYTGTDTATDNIIRSYHVDVLGNLTPLHGQTRAEDITYGNLPEYASLALATTALGTNRPFRWSQINFDGVISPNGSQSGITK